ncbi:MAG: nitrate reductase subunit alpha [Streptococcaceae bacterium]|jgi:nitrate reductase alpha subunit|nr:nitrate reductase subunit alpha [Streptococcaceae bacterium]
MKFFTKTEKFNGSFSQLEKSERRWEETYRRRWAHDKVVRTTHGVNCTGSCSWNVYVKEGLITWEHQATDYPTCGPNMPDFEPRGCPRGASFSWYEYSPLRIKYPYVRGVLWTLWEAAKEEFADDKVKAWASIVEAPEKAEAYKSARGHGGLVRVTWDDALEIITAMLGFTIKKYGPDRIAGFSPIPAQSMISFAAGSRFLSLLGGEMMSFYDWYADLPPASPQVWGEQTDVPESSDWYNSGYLMMWGSNVPLTRTPDAHFMTEVRYKGTKVVAVSPDYAENVKFADNWLAPHPGTDAALAQGMTHVILEEFYMKRSTPYFDNYVKQYTDLPFLVILDEKEGNHTAGRFLRLSDLRGEKASENAAWKPVLIDENDGEIKVPNGTIGQRWDEHEKWNLKLDGIAPALSVGNHQLTEIQFPYFDENGARTLTRKVAAKYVRFENGEAHLVATVFDLLIAQYGFNDNNNTVYTPAWASVVTGVKASVIRQIAREFAQNAVDTQGKSMVIMGAGINQWFNSDMTYRAIFNLIMLCGTEGVNGGGWAHYVGQEKLRPAEGWAAIAFANDWNKGAARQQNGPSFWYFHSDQWKYDELDNEALKNPLAKKTANSYKHPADYNQLAIRLGWLPSYPQLNRNSLDFVKEYGTLDEAQVRAKVVAELKAGSLEFAAQAPDRTENQPKALFVWRSNLFSSSAKGQEYFMKHLLGAENGLMARTNENFKPDEMEWVDDEVKGKLDLVVTLDFRMVATPMYSDIVLPAATWYEKEDLSSTDMHPFIHPFNAAVSPLWESKTDWQIFRQLAKKFSELAEKEFTEPVYDLHLSPIMHDTKGELAQPFGKVKDWKKGEIDAIPGVTMPNIKLVKRDYTKIYEQFVTLGPALENGRVGAIGLSYPIGEEYTALKDKLGATDAGLPSIYDEKRVANAILRLSSASNGAVSRKAWEAAEEEHGVPLADIASGYVHTDMDFESITVQPSAAIPTPIGTSANVGDERYSSFSLQIRRLVPFRTLTGRQQFYMDHEIFEEYGEQLTTYKPTLPPHVMGPKDREIAPSAGRELTLRYMTPHGKWNIHTMYGDNLEMLTLFRGGPVVWISNEDAADAAIKDNDWVEVYNRNGVFTCRAVVSHRMPKGTLYSYHGQDMTVNSPLSALTGNRGGSHNAPTQIQLKPTQMVGGYAQLSYGWNYYGPIGNQRDLYCNVRKLDTVDWPSEPKKGGRK